MKKSSKTNSSSDQSLSQIKSKLSSNFNNFNSIKSDLNISLSKDYFQKAIEQSKKYIASSEYIKADKILLKALKLFNKLSFLKFRADFELICLNICLSYARLCQKINDSKTGLNILEPLICHFKIDNLIKNSNFSMSKIEKLFLLIGEFALNQNDCEKSLHYCNLSKKICNNLLENPKFLREFRILLNENDDFNKEILKKWVILALCEELTAKVYERQKKQDLALDHYQAALHIAKRKIGEKSSLVSKFKNKCKNLEKKLNFQKEIKLSNPIFYKKSKSEIRSPRLFHEKSIEIEVIPPAQEINTSKVNNSFLKEENSTNIGNLKNKLYVHSFLEEVKQPIKNEKQIKPIKNSFYLTHKYYPQNTSNSTRLPLTTLIAKSTSFLSKSIKSTTKTSLNLKQNNSITKSFNQFRLKNSDLSKLNNFRNSLFMTNRPENAPYLTPPQNQRKITETSPLETTPLISPMPNFRVSQENKLKENFKCGNLKIDSLTYKLNKKSMYFNNQQQSSRNTRSERDSAKSKVENYKEIRTSESLKNKAKAYFNSDKNRLSLRNKDHSGKRGEKSAHSVKTIIRSNSKEFSWSREVSEDFINEKEKIKSPSLNNICENDYNIDKSFHSDTLLLIKDRPKLSDFPLVMRREEKNISKKTSHNVFNKYKQKQVMNFDEVEEDLYAKNVKKNIAALKIQDFYKNRKQFRFEGVVPILYKKGNLYLFGLRKSNFIDINDKYACRVKWGFSPSKLPHTPKNSKITENLIGKDFATLVCELNKNDILFPRYAFSFAFQAASSQLNYLREFWKVNISELSIEKSNIILIIRLINNKNLFQIRLNSPLTDINSECLDFQHVWPLIDDFLNRWFKNQNFYNEFNSYKSIKDKVIWVYDFPNEKSFNPQEKNKFFEVYRKLLFLLEKKIILKTKLNGKIWELTTPNQHFLLSNNIKEISNFKLIRNQIIKSLGTSITPLSSKLYAYLSYGQTIENHDPTYNNSLFFTNFSQPPPPSSSNRQLTRYFSQKDVIKPPINHYTSGKLSSLSSYLSPISNSKKLSISGSGMGLSINPKPCINDTFKLKIKHVSESNFHEKPPIIIGRSLQTIALKLKEKNKDYENDSENQLEYSFDEPIITPNNYIEPPDTFRQKNLSFCSIVQENKFENGFPEPDSNGKNSCLPNYLMEQSKKFPIVIPSKFLNPFYQNQILFKNLFFIQKSFIIIQIELNFSEKSWQIPDFDDFLIIIKATVIQTKWNDSLQFKFKDFIDIFFNEFNFEKFLLKGGYDKLQKYCIEKILKQRIRISKSFLVFTEKTKSKYIERKKKEIAKECIYYNIAKNKEFTRKNLIYCEIKRKYSIYFIKISYYFNLIQIYQPLGRQCLYYRDISSENLKKLKLIINNCSSQEIKSHLFINLRPIISRIGKKIIYYCPENMHKPIKTLYTSYKIKGLLRCYCKIELWKEKNDLLIIKIELLSLNSRKKWFFNFEETEIFPQNIVFSLYFIQKKILSKLFASQNLLYKTIKFQTKNERTFKTKSNNSNSNKYLELDFGYIRQIGSFFKKIDNYLVLFNIYKHQKLDFWRVTIYFPKTSRILTTNLFNSDIFLMQEKFWDNHFPESPSKLLNNNLESMEIKFWQKIVNLSHVTYTILEIPILNIGNYNGILQENIFSKHTNHYQLDFIISLSSIKKGPLSIELSSKTLAKSQLLYIKGVNFNNNHTFGSKIEINQLFDRKIKKIKHIELLNRCKIMENEFSEVFNGKKTFSEIFNENNHKNSSKFKFNNEMKNYEINILCKEENLLIWRGIFMKKPRLLLSIFINKKRKLVNFIVFHTKSKFQWRFKSLLADCSSQPLKEYLERDPYFYKTLGIRLFKSHKNSLLLALYRQKPEFIN